MFEFDMMTSLMIIIVSLTLSFCIMIFIWRKYRNTISGISCFLAYFILMIVGVVLTILRANLPTVVSIVLSNLIIFVAKLILLYGITMFYKAKMNALRVTNGLILYTIGFVIFTYIYPSIPIRITINAIFLAAVHVKISSIAYKESRKGQVRFLILPISNLNILYYIIRIAIIHITRESYSSIFDYSYDPMIILLEGLIGILTVIGIYDMISNRFFLKSIEAERSKNQLINNVPGFAYRCEFDKDWTMTYLSSAFEDTTGYKIDEVINNKKISYNQIIAEEHRDRVHREFEIGALQNANVAIEYEVIKKDGERVWLWEQGKSIYGSDGSIIAIEGHISDITKIKKAEAEYKKFKLIADKALNGHLITDMNDMVIYCNEYYSKVHGYEVREVLNKHVNIFYTKKRWEDYLKLKDKMIESDFLEPLEIVHKRKNGEHFTMLVSGIAFFDDDLKAKLLVFNSIDITDLKKLAEEKEAAEIATKEKSQFLANMSHEIRTPINAIIGLNELSSYTNLSEKQRDYNTKISISAKSLLRIINDILDFSKIESGKMSMEKTKLKVSRVLKDVETQIIPSAEEKGIDIVFYEDENIPEYLVGDPVRLKQVLLNLSSNAVKFTNSGKVEIKSKLLEEKKKSVIIKFSVADTGIGMTKEQVGRLFTPFTQADASTTRKFGGTGLGLAISKSLVDLMAGDIGVHSVYGKGSKFYFTCRLKKYVDGTEKDGIVKNFSGDLAEKQNKGAADKDSKGIDCAKKNISVLLVEDNVINQMVAQEILELDGFIVDIADNGKIAIEKLQENNEYDVVLMDLQMPTMDGYEATRIIRNEIKLEDIPIVALSADAMEGTRDTALEAGMDDYITKPIDHKGLTEKIMQIVNID